jgi:ornithine carbamoyltransferase
VPLVHLKKIGEVGLLQGRDFLTLQDCSQEDIWQILEKTRKLKQETSSEKLRQVLLGKNIAIIFQKPSTRTRISFEVAIEQLGSHALYLDWSQLQLGRGETVADTARVLDRYVDGIVARVFSQNHLDEMAKYAAVPVINALSNLFHPCQIICDLYTIWEKKKSLKCLKLAYVGDGKNVCNSMLIGCTKMGMNISVACPDEFKPYSKAMKWALKNAKETGSKVEVTAEPEKAVEKADVIYTDVFVSMGSESEREKRMRAFMPKYQVTERLFTYAAEDAAFMHCLPAHRGEEVTNEVIDGSRSIIWDQAENRLHTARALLALLVPP